MTEFLGIDNGHFATVETFSVVIIGSIQSQ